MTLIKKPTWWWRITLAIVPAATAFIWIWTKLEPYSTLVIARLQSLDFWVHTSSAAVIAGPLSKRCPDRELHDEHGRAMKSIRDDEKSRGETPGFNCVLVAGEGDH